jgi:hypothetical protein
MEPKAVAGRRHAARVRIGTFIGVLLSVAPATGDLASSTRRW